MPVKLGIPKKSLLGISLLVGTSFFCFINYAQAVSISPLTFDISVNPGETVTNYITVFNNDNFKGAYVAEAEDFSAVGEQGNVVIEKDAPAAISAKKWLSFEPETFEVESGGSKDIKFTLSVPLNADPGGKYSSILISSGPKTSEPGTVSLATKVASLLLIRVAGSVTEKLTVQSLEAPNFSEFGPINLVLKIKNEGTVHLKPAGFIVIKDWTGREVEKLSLPQQRIIPGTIRAIDTPWKASWLFGKYTANFAGIYGLANDSLSASVSFWIIPWKMMSYAFLGLIILGLILWSMRKRLLSAIKIILKGEA